MADPYLSKVRVGRVNVLLPPRGWEPEEVNGCGGARFVRKRWRPRGTETACYEAVGTLLTSPQMTVYVFRRGPWERKSP